MTIRVSLNTPGLAWVLAAWLMSAAGARADVVTDANTRAAEIASTVRATPIAVRTMALVQVSVHDAVQSVSGRYRPLIATSAATPGASVDAAVAAATRTALLALVPGERAAIEADYQAALAALPESAAKADGIAAGERAASAVLAARTGDGAETPGTYRPRATPGTYVPTTLPLLPNWGRRKPWLLSAGNQVRPGPPPRLDSDTWRRDLAEIASVGGRRSTRRTAEQTAIARFWETTSPTVYWPVVRSVATARGADASDTARLLAEAAVAMDDALIAVFDAKYAYEFWRPITAIRNAPADVGDPGWEPLIETPMHPEYPCAHCIVSAAVAAVLEASIGDGPSPPLRSTSPTAGGAERTWANPEEFVREVSEARICAGVHYRHSTEVGQAMGRRIGALAQGRFPEAAP
jgi:hypothetical protein